MPTSRIEIARSPSVGNARVMLLTTIAAPRPRPVCPIATPSGIAIRTAMSSAERGEPEVLGDAPGDVDVTGRGRDAVRRIEDPRDRLRDEVHTALPGSTSRRGSPCEPRAPSVTAAAGSTAEEATRSADHESSNTAASSEYAHDPGDRLGRVRRRWNGTSVKSEPRLIDADDARDARQADGAHGHHSDARPAAPVRRAGARPTKNRPPCGEPDRGGR